MLAAKTGRGLETMLARTGTQFGFAT